MNNAHPIPDCRGRGQSSGFTNGYIVFLLLMLFSAVALAKPSCPGHPSCSDDGGDDKQSVALDCLIASDYGSGDTLLDDGDLYIHGQENVVCRTGEVGKVNLSGLVFSAFQGKTKGKNAPASREMDLALSLNPDPDLDTTHLPDSIFQAGVFEHLRIAVRPYKADQTDIQRLPPDWVYPMALQINEQVGNDWKINLAGAVVAGDSLQGVLCNDNPAAVTTDVNVYVWEDNNADGNPDGYTVTTGSYDLNSNGDWVLSEGPMTASVCSNSGDLDCAHQSDRWCNYLGEVYVQFTIDMAVQ